MTKSNYAEEPVSTGYKIAATGGRGALGLASLFFVGASLSYGYAELMWSAATKDSSVGVGTSTYCLVLFARAGVLAVLSLASAAIGLAARRYTMS